jgi:lactococcin 972 family bacteriocin
MKLKIRAIATTAIVGALVLGAPLAAEAQTIKKVGGGTWTYGVFEPASTAFVFSEYKHSSKEHRATACSRNDNCVKTPFKAPRKTARAEKVASMSGNTAFWATR